MNNLLATFCLHFTRTLILWGAARAGTNTLGVRITDVRIHKQTVDLSKAQAADRYTQKYTCINYSASNFSVFTALTQEWKVSYNSDSFSMFHQATHCHWVLATPCTKQLIYTATSIWKIKQQKELDYIAGFTLHTLQTQNVQKANMISSICICQNCPTVNIQL